MLESSILKENEIRSKKQFSLKPAQKRFREEVGWLKNYSESGPSIYIKLVQLQKKARNYNREPLFQSKCWGAGDGGDKLMISREIYLFSAEGI